MATETKEKQEIVDKNHFRLFNKVNTCNFNLFFNGRFANFLLRTNI